MLAGVGVFGFGTLVGQESKAFFAHPPLDELLQTYKSAAADEQDVGSVNLDEFLVRMLAASLRRHVRHRPLEDLEESLLHTFSRYVARDGRILVLAGDLVDLVDINDALLALFLIAAGILEQFENDILDVLSHVTGFRQCGCVDNGERHRQHLGQRLRQQRFAGSGRADQQHVALLQLQVATLLRDFQAFVVVVDCYGELLLGDLLADDIKIKKLFYFQWFRQLVADRGGHDIVGDDFIADVHALVADIYRRPCNELLYVILAFGAE